MPSVVKAQSPNPWTARKFPTVSLEISINLVNLFFLKILLASLGNLHFHVNFKISLSVSPKK